MQDESSPPPTSTSKEDPTNSDHSKSTSEDGKQYSQGPAKAVDILAELERSEESSPSAFANHHPEGKSDEIDHSNFESNSDNQDILANWDSSEDDMDAEKKSSTSYDRSNYEETSRAEKQDDTGILDGLKSQSENKEDPEMKPTAIAEMQTEDLPTKLENSSTASTERSSVNMLADIDQSNDKSQLNDSPSDAPGKSLSIMGNGSTKQGSGPAKSGHSTANLSTATSSKKSPPSKSSTSSKDEEYGEEIHPEAVAFQPKKNGAKNGVSPPNTAFDKTDSTESTGVASGSVLRPSATRPIQKAFSAADYIKAAQEALQGFSDGNSIIKDGTTTEDKDEERKGTVPAQGKWMVCPQESDDMYDRKPRAAASRASSAKRRKNDEKFQPMSVEGSDYYLHDDEMIVEEDPLPPRPWGVFSEAKVQAPALPASSSLAVHQLAPKSVGGIQDQVHSLQQSCVCKVSSTANRKAGQKDKSSGSKCLKLYCNCFSMGLYCNERCRCHASCYNNASPSNIDRRTAAVAEALSEDPHAFRHNFANVAAEQKRHRSLLAKADVHVAKARRASSKAKIPPRGVSKSFRDRLPMSDLLVISPPRGKRKRKKKMYEADYRRKGDIASSEVLSAQLPPSFYSLPLVVNDGSEYVAAPGISFSLTHPRHKKRRTKSAKKQISHDLMESPIENLNTQVSEKTEAPAASIRGAAHCPDVKQSGIADTALQLFWKEEIQKTNHYFDAMRSGLDGALRLEPNEINIKATVALKSLEHDLESIKTVVEASGMDILARFFKERRLTAGYGYGSNKIEEKTADLSGCAGLLCDEELQSVGGLEPVVEDSMTKELSILAAQDTALLQETARIIKRRARELSERRLLRSDAP